MEQCFQKRDTNFHSRIQYPVKPLFKCEDKMTFPDMQLLNLGRNFRVYVPFLRKLLKNEETQDSGNKGSNTGRRQREFPK